MDPFSQSLARLCLSACLLVLVLCDCISPADAVHRRAAVLLPWTAKPATEPVSRTQLPVMMTVRGGGSDSEESEEYEDEDEEEEFKGEDKQENFGTVESAESPSTDSLMSASHAADDDDERYSRQVYTLGARAHGLVRAATIYVDGPSSSGLTYECVKNLALSGVGKIVLVDGVDNDNDNVAYHNPNLDDLGRTYQRAARTEAEEVLGKAEASKLSDKDTLLQFVRRLNPYVSAGTISRSELMQDLLLGSDKSSTQVVLCIDRPLSVQLSWSHCPREYGTQFVSVETAGVYGRVFCDFGNDFVVEDADGEAPLIVPLDRVEVSEYDQNLVHIHCVEGEKHDVSKGDVVEFQTAHMYEESITVPSFMVTKVHTPGHFSARMLVEDGDDTSINEYADLINAKTTSFSRNKLPILVPYISLEEALKATDGSLHVACDLEKSFDATRRTALTDCFQRLSNFVQEHHRLPNIRDRDDFCDTDDKEYKVHCDRFVTTCAAKFAPLQAMFGAIASQETLKAVTGLYNPVQQFLLYDCDEVLEEGIERDDSSKASSGLSYILGAVLCEKLASQKLFVVGAGAIGCEILKNLAAMGTKKVVVTDMDTIERSNLSRQLLYRDSDIGSFKSQAAEHAIRRYNPDLQMEVHTSKVGGDEHGPFDEKFWSKCIDVVLNALDNVEARLFIDSQCVAHGKSLVDAGTLGSKGNVQVVLPFQSESYGSSPDPPEPAIPVCTLKNFPYLIAHTIQWGRDLFDGLFARRPRNVNEYRAKLQQGIDVASELIRDFGEESAVDVAKELAEDLPSSEHGASASAAIDWAVGLSRKYFYDAIHELLVQHPVGSLDEDGEPFWSGARKVPTPLSYTSGQEDPRQASINENIINFVITAARLRIETFHGESLDCQISRDDVVRLLERQSYDNVCVANTKEKDGDDEEEKDKIDVSKQIVDIIENINVPEECDRNTFFVAEFEKDDDTNGHVDFITAASNLRAMCYGIAPVDVMETRRVAGKIVPAMITTTALVSALSCVELVKIVQSAPIYRHRNAFINLALPFFAFTAPLPAETIPGLRGQEYTLWNRIDIKEGSNTAASRSGLTMRRLLRKIKARLMKDIKDSDPDFNEDNFIEISTISYGSYMLYASFLHDGDEKMATKNFWDVAEDAVQSGMEFDSEYSRRSENGHEGTNAAAMDIRSRSAIDLTVVIEDTATGEEIELPPVRLHRSKPMKKSISGKSH